MNHPAEEQFVLHYYGEEDGVLDQHLASCEACREEYRKLQRVLNTVESLPVPERPPGYGAAVWERIRPAGDALPARGWRGWLNWRRAAVVAAMASLVFAAFLAGRYAQHSPARPMTAAGGVRERILLVAVGDHLERSQMVLAELSNLGAAREGQVDISYERHAAQDLVDSSRLFRMTASSTGDTATAGLLDELERVLLDIANGPPEMSGTELRRLQKQIADQGILFKVRVFASGVGAKENKL